MPKIRSSKAGATDASVADLVTNGTSTKAALNGAYARRRMYDVRDYTGADDMGAAINRAIDAAFNDTFTYGKPGQVVLPPMSATITTAIVPKKGVDIIGSGWGKTVLRPQGVSAFNGLYPYNAPLTDVLFADFEIDGSLHTGTYSTTEMKGMYLQHLWRCTFEHLYIHHTGASGLGVDFLSYSTIRDVIANNCGRLNGGSNPGGAGIGIGTGTGDAPSAIEDVLVEQCITESNGRDGLFFETQVAGVFLQGVRVVGHRSYANGAHGIADAGCDGLQIFGGHTKGNQKSGFAAYAGTVGNSAPGRNGRVVGLTSRDNVLNGFHYDNSAAEGIGAYEFIDCYASGNQQHGFKLEAKTAALPNMRIANSRSRSNAAAGIVVSATAGGTFTDLNLSGNETYQNGTAGSVTEGIGIRAGVTRLTVQGGRSGKGSTATQTIGLNILAGVTVTGGLIDGIDLADNTTPMNVGGTLTGVRLGVIPGHTVASGTPEGSKVAPIGTLYSRTDGGAGTSLYVKETGSSNTGWRAV